MKYFFLLFGTAFGFLLSRAGATTFDFYAQLFLFTDLQLLWVIGTAGVVGMAGTWLLKRLHAQGWYDRQPLSFQGKSMRPTLIAGALLFGIGWGLAGACPGTAPVMLGEGKMAAGFTILGIIFGTYLYGRLHNPQPEGAVVTPARAEM